jgi:hypothetical protein
MGALATYRLHLGIVEAGVNLVLGQEAIVQK